MTCLVVFSAGSGTTVYENEFTEEDTTPQLDYTSAYGQQTLTGAGPYVRTYHQTVSIKDLASVAHMTVANTSGVKNKQLSKKVCKLLDFCSKTFLGNQMIKRI